MARQKKIQLSEEARAFEATRFGLLTGKLAGHIRSGCLSRVTIQWTAAGKLNVQTTAADGRDIREVIEVTPYGYEIRDPANAPVHLTQRTPAESLTPTSDPEPPTTYQLDEAPPKRSVVRRRSKAGA